jgi:hypothetical protein
MVNLFFESSYAAHQHNDMGILIGGQLPTLGRSGSYDSGRFLLESRPLPFLFGDLYALIHRLPRGES